MTKEFKEVKDSGKRQEFSTGSVRDTDEGKGTPHLLPGEVMIQIEQLIGHNLHSYNYSGQNPEIILKKLTLDVYEYGIIRGQEFPLTLIDAIEGIIIYITLQENEHYTDAFKRLSVHYQNGAKKYNKNNWRKGQFVSRYYDSAVRHLWDVQAGRGDEDHASALLWNLIAIIQTKKDVAKGLLPKELDDFPFTISETFKKKDSKDEDYCKCVYESDCHGIEMIKTPLGREFAIGGINTKDRFKFCPYCGKKIKDSKGESSN